MQMKNMYYKNITLDDVDEKTCIIRNIALDDVDEKTCIIKTLHLMIDEKHVLKKQLTCKNMYYKKHCT